MKQHTKQFLFASLILTTTSILSTSAIAQVQGSGLYYVGASIGQAEMKDLCDSVSGFSGNCDKKDIRWKAFGGYQFDRNFAIEGAYVDLGKGSLSGIKSSANFTKSYDPSTWQLSGVGMFPLTTHFSLIGKLGVHRWKAKSSQQAGAVPSSDSETGTGTTFGMGLNYDLARNMGMRAEWERFKSVGKSSTTGKSDIDLLSVGMQYRF